MKERKYHILILLITVMLIGSCSKSPSILMEGTECEPPCWKGITPGITNIAETMTIIKGIEYIRKFPNSEDSIATINDRGYVSFLFSSEVREAGGMIFFRDDIVYKIQIDYGKMSFGEFVRNIGPPEKYYAVIDRVETVWVSINLLYPSQGIVATHYDDKFFGVPTGSFKAKENMEIRWVYYFDPRAYEEVLREEVFVGIYGVSEETLEKAIHDWKGFGKIEPLNLLER